MKNLILFLLLTIGLMSCNQNEGPVGTDSNKQTVTPTETDVLPPVINSFTGYSDGVGVSNGKWNGQGAACLSGSNQYKGYNVVDCYNYGGITSNPYYWEINGNNFGTANGSVTVTGVSVSIVSWSNTKIRIKPYSSYTLSPRTNVSVTVIKPSNGGNATKNLEKGITPILKSRAMGQCTYEVAYRRIAANKPVPPTAYSYTGDINSGYIPQQYDVLDWDLDGNGVANDHTGIITSSVTVSGSGNNKIYTFTLTERNATCSEQVTTKTCNFKPYTNTGIYSLASSTRQAKKYFR